MLGLIIAARSSCSWREGEVPSRRNALEARWVSRQGFGAGRRRVERERVGGKTFDTVHAFYTRQKQPVSSKDAAEIEEDSLKARETVCARSRNVMPLRRCRKLRPHGHRCSTGKRFDRPRALDDRFFGIRAEPIQDLGLRHRVCSTPGHIIATSWST